ncbi:MAG: ATP-binding protein, partial [Longicatena sp.]
KNILNYLNTVSNMFNETIIKSNISFCDNIAVDSLLKYYYSLAKNKDISINIRLILPHTLPISDVDFCTILGNLLENAIEGCRTLSEEKRKLKLRISSHAGNLMLTIDNTFDGKLHLNNGEILSRKRGNEKKGIGLSSVMAVAEKYDGFLRWDVKDGWFLVSVQMSIK